MPPLLASARLLACMHSMHACSVGGSHRHSDADVKRENERDQLPALHGLAIRHLRPKGAPPVESSELAPVVAVP